MKTDCDESHDTYEYGGLTGLTREEYMGYRRIEAENIAIQNSGPRKTPSIWSVRKIIDEPSNFPSQVKSVRCMAVDPSNTYLYTAGSDKCISKWDLKTQSVVCKAENAHKKIILALAISPKNSCVFSTCYKGFLKQWDLENLQELNPSDKPHHEDSIKCLLVSKDEKTVVTGGDDSQVKLWDAQQKTAQSGFGQVHSSPISSLAFANKLDYLFSGTIEGELKQWKFSEKKELKTCQNLFKDWVSSMVQTSDDQFQFAGSYSNFKQLKPDTLEVLKNFEHAHDHYILTMCLIQDDKIQLTGGADYNIKGWSVKEQKRKEEFKNVHTDDIGSLLVLEQTKRMLSASLDGQITSWEIIED